jgi:hypothetical protein
MLNPLAGITSINKLFYFPSQALYMKTVSKVNYEFFGTKMSQRYMYVYDDRDFKIRGKDRSLVRIFVAILAM